MIRDNTRSNSSLKLKHQPISLTVSKEKPVAQHLCSFSFISHFFLCFVNQPNIVLTQVQTLELDNNHYIYPTDLVCRLSHNFFKPNKFVQLPSFFSSFCYDCQQPNWPKQVNKIPRQNKFKPAPIEAELTEFISNSISSHPSLSYVLWPVSINSSYHVTHDPLELSIEPQFPSPLENQSKRFLSL